MAGGRGLIISGSISLGLGVVGFLLEGSNHDVCNSGLGVVSQAINQQAARQCGADNFVWYLGIVLMIVGGALLLGGLVAHSRARRPAMAQAPPPMTPPGWYQDPSGATNLRWWDGYNWTPATRMPDG